MSDELINGINMVEKTKEGNIVISYKEKATEAILKAIAQTCPFPLRADLAAELATELLQAREFITKAKKQNRKFFDALLLLQGNYEIMGSTNHPEYKIIHKTLLESDESVRE
jgi:hypothetical protein